MVKDMNTIIFKLFVLSILSLCTCNDVYSKVRFVISDGVDNAQLKNKMEKSVSALLDEINMAAIEKRSLHLNNINMNDDAQSELKMLWKNSHFLCEDLELVERCLTTNHGYQVRNIPLTLKPLGDEANSSEYQEAVIGFSKTGRITSFSLAISVNVYSKVMQNTTEISDVLKCST